MKDKDPTWYRPRSYSMETKQVCLIKKWNFSSFSLFYFNFYAGTAKLRAEKKCQAHATAGSEITTRPSFGSKPSDLPVAIKYLAINPTFMGTTVAGCSDMLLITAFGIFLPKFIENQFSTTATVATAIVGN